MSYESQRAAIQGRLRDNWSDTPIEYEEVKYTPVQGTSYVTIWIIPGETEQIAMGGPTHRTIDIVQVDINVPAESGVKTISTYADSMIAIFKGAQFSGITFYGWDIFRTTIEGWLRWSIRWTVQRDEE